MGIRQYKMNGLDFVLLENAHIRTQFLPQWGGKMVELLNKDLQTQFLLEPTVEHSKSMLPYYGIKYNNYFRSGFDECFPTIEESTYSSGNKEHRYFPEHGELWSIPWKIHTSESSIILSVRGVRAAYEMRKKITLSERAVHIHYTVYNLTQKNFFYLWAGNLQLEIIPKSQLILPKSVKNVFLGWTTNANIRRQGEYLSWPNLIQENETNYAIIQNPGKDLAVKFYVETFHKGNYGFYRADTGASLHFKFDARETPYLGICLCYSGKSKDQDSIAFQPSNGRTESLESGIKQNNCTVIQSKQAKEWTLDLYMSDEPKKVHNSVVRE